MIGGDSIVVRGARTHNLKGLDLDIPKGKLVVFTGLSGAGKSSLVFDTIHTEAQRQLVETFSSFARRRLPKLSRPPVDEIRNLSTSIVIDQKPLGRTLRSTVGTATEIATYFRLLYSRFAAPWIGPSFFFSFNNPEGMCPACSGLGKRISIAEEKFYDPAKSLREGAILHPDYKVGGFHWGEFMVMDGIEPDKRLGDYTREELDFLLHTEAVPVSKKHGAGTTLKNFTGLIRRLEQFYANRAEDELPEEEKGVYESFLSFSRCEACGGARLNERARSARLNGLGIHEASALELSSFIGFLDGIDIPGTRSLVCKMRSIAANLVRIGLGYLSLDRAISTLSGGESQRLKMARQLDCDLSGLLYVLDEPSAGLHPRDNASILAMLRSLRDAGNSVLVVEHDPELIAAADWVVEIGPEAGKGGGRLLYSGSPAGLLSRDSPTAAALGPRKPASRPRRPWRESFQVRGAWMNNLKGLDAEIPKGVLVCVAGAAGSGKSSLVLEVFAREHPEAVVVGQTAIGRSSRGNCATYLGAFDPMRKEMAKALGLEASLLSFNSKGACPKCGGSGSLSVEMSFLDDVRMTCDECGGSRYREEVLSHSYRGKNIAEILELTAAEAAPFFDSPEVRRRLSSLAEVGLGYLSIGQSLSSLSGGEAQRLKLAAELHKTGKIYILDEPSSGLHVADTARLVSILDRLVEAGNSVIVIEHNLELIAAADWVIDMGPGGGAEGGRILAAGRPEDIAADPESLTGPYLRPLLGLAPAAATSAAAVEGV